MVNATKDFEEKFKARSVTNLEPAGLDCVKCWESGFVWIDVDGVAAWVYCRCKYGKLKESASDVNLPTYDYDVERIFPAKKFPWQAFVPSGFKSFADGINNRMRAFKNDLKNSELFWRQKMSQSGHE